MDITQTETYNQFLALRPCSYATDWIEANKYQSTEWLWNNCPDASWMLWLIGKTSLGKVSSSERKRLVLCCCEIARTVLCLVPEEAIYLVPEEGYRPRIAIETAERYCRGVATLTEVITAAGAGDDADADVRAVCNAAAAAYNAAAAAAYGVGYAYFTILAAAAAARYAEITIDFPAIVRKHYPECPI